VKASYVTERLKNKKIIFLLFLEEKIDKNFENENLTVSNIATMITGHILSKKIKNLF
jgi:hypothetical protein